jgi:transcriptional regulator with XRE-family HTH domain
LIKEARRLSGLSQRSLADKAGTAQSVVARIELGLASPSVDTLERLLRAAGFQLGVRLEPRVELDPSDLAESARVLALTPEERLRPAATSGPSGLDVERVISALGWHRVQYLLAGVLAARLQGMPRQTLRMEIVPAKDLPNLKALAAALRELDPRVYSAAVPEGLAFDCSATTLGRAVAWDLVTRAGRIALVFEPAGLGGFDDLARRAITIEVFKTAVMVEGLGDVIQSIRLAGHPEDRHDLLLLQHLASEGKTP